MTKLRSEVEVIRTLAERIMGWRVIAWLTGPDDSWQARDESGKVRATSDDAGLPATAWNNWNPLRNVADAMELAEHFGGGYDIECRAEDIRYFVSLFVSLWDSPVRSQSDPSEGWYHGGKTLQEAVTGAALASIGCEYEPKSEVRA